MSLQNSLKPCLKSVPSLNEGALNELIHEQEQGLLFAMQMERKASGDISQCWAAMREARQQLATFERIRATHAGRLLNLYQQRDALMVCSGVAA